MPPRSHQRSPKIRPLKTSWEFVSDWYADYLSKPGTLQREVIFPGVIRLLDLKRDDHVLDLACGEGAFAALLAQKTGAHVTGLDAAPSLIARAKQRSSLLLRFLEGDATRFADLFPPQSFNGMSCILALQNIETISPIFADAARVLKPNAPFVIVINHPCFRQPRQSGWGWDETRALQYRRIDRYLSAYEMPILAHPGSRPHLKTFSYHRSFQTYVTELAHQGFMIDALEEWISTKVSSSGPRAKAENVARAEIPLFLAIRARKTF